MGNPLFQMCSESTLDQFGHGKTLPNPPNRGVLCVPEKKRGNKQKMKCCNVKLLNQHSNTDILSETCCFSVNILQTNYFCAGFFRKVTYRRYITEVKYQKGTLQKGIYKGKLQKGDLQKEFSHLSKIIPDPLLCG